MRREAKLFRLITYLSRNHHLKNQYDQTCKIGKTLMSFFDQIGQTSKLLTNHFRTTEYKEKLLDCRKSFYKGRKKVTLS